MLAKYIQDVNADYRRIRRQIPLSPPGLTACIA
jgi:hypothetical protein